jgi:hypothetical protein
MMSADLRRDRLKENRTCYCVELTRQLTILTGTLNIRLEICFVSSGDGFLAGVQRFKKDLDLRAVPLVIGTRWGGE